MLPVNSDERNQRSHTLLKWGPFVVICTAMAFVAGAVILNDGSSTVEATEEIAAPEDDSIGAPEPTGLMPITYDEASEAGTEEDRDWGEVCDTETGQVKLPMVFASPCVPVFEDDNGGAQSPGVSQDTIKVVWYKPDESMDLTALLGGQGLDETPEDQFDTLQDWVELYSSVSETYGREIELIPFYATGTEGDAVASRADAERIAEEHEPFAVLGGPRTDGGAFAGELARNEIVCLGCSLALPDCKIQDIAPYAWGTAPSNTQFIATLLEWMGVDEGGSGLTGKAEFAGDPVLAASERKVGVVHFEQDPPIMGECTGDNWGDEAVVEPYLLDFGAMPQVAVEIMAKMKSEGVTTVIFMGDPLMPIYLTNAAQNIDFHPEWVFTGTVLTDTNVFGRQYEQNQMAHAFGVSQTGVPIPPESYGGAMWLYKWYFGEDATPAALSQYQVVGANVPRLLRGIHMAGPELSAETFSRALFRVPPLGGGPTTPQTSNGHWGFFDTTDYNGVDDLTEIWWDAEAVGENEIGVEGLGMWRYVDGGTRFTTLNPTTPNPFVVEGTVTNYEEAPPESRAPEYPPPAGSPAAG